MRRLRGRLGWACWFGGCLERSYQGAGYLAGTRACRASWATARTLFPKGEGSVEVVSVGGRQAQWSRQEVGQLGQGGGCRVAGAQVQVSQC